MTAFQTLDLAVDGKIAVATFNRPDALNTFSVAVMKDLIAVLDQTDADDAIRAVVVTGSGRAFCAGADLNQGRQTFAYATDANSGDIEVDGLRRDRGGRLAFRVFHSLKPVIAAVNGVAVGIGATLLLAMDGRLASTDARFGFPFVRRGVTPEACASWLLPRLVGVPTALDWLCSGRVFEATEAQARGLIETLHAPEDLLPAALAYARRMSEHSAPVSIALTRQMVWQMMFTSHPMDAHWIESRALVSRGQSADAAEGIQAFLDKRPASFPDLVSKDMPSFFPWSADPTFGPPATTRPD